MRPLRRWAPVGERGSSGEVSTFLYSLQVCASDLFRRLDIGTLATAKARCAAAAARRVRTRSTRRDRRCAIASAALQARPRGTRRNLSDNHGDCDIVGPSGIAGTWRTFASLCRGRSVVTLAQDDGSVHAASVGCRLPRRPTGSGAIHQDIHLMHRAAADFIAAERCALPRCEPIGPSVCEHVSAELDEERVIVAFTRVRGVVRRTWRPVGHLLLGVDRAHRADVGLVARGA